MELKDVVGIAAVLLAIGAGLGVAAFQAWRSSRRWETYERLWDCLSVVVPMVRVGRFMGHGSGQLGGRPWVAELTKGSRYSPAYLRFRLALSQFASNEPLLDGTGRPVRGPAGARFRPRTWWDRAGSALGLARPFRTGDAAFDAKVAVDSAASDTVLRALLSGEAARRAVTGLLDSGARTVDVLVAAPFATASWRSPTLELAGRVLDAPPALSVLADAIPLVAGDPVQRGGGVGIAWVPIGFAAVGMASLFAWLEMAGPHPIVHEGSSSLTLLGLLLYLPVCVATYFVLRRRTGALSMFVYSLPAALFASVFGALAVGHAVNIGGDPGEAESHDVRVTSVHTYSSRRSLSSTEEREIRVRSWVVEGPEVLISVPASGPRYSVGDRVRVVSKPGRLGWEWVESVEPIAEGPSRSALPGVPPSGATTGPPQ